MIRLVQGWTERIVYDLTKRRSPTEVKVPQPLLGMTVALKLYTRAGVLVTPAGTPGILDAESGQVYYDPAPGELLASLSPYLVRWEVTDSGGRKAYFPNGDMEIWIVASR